MTHARAAAIPTAFLPAGRQRSDPWLLVAVLILLAWGLLMVYSSSSALALVRKNGNDLFYLQSQFVRGLLGLGMLLALSRLDARILAGRTGWILWGALLLLLVILVLPFGPGEEVRGTRRWLRVGRSLIQPSEFARLAMILLLAGILSRGRHTLRSWRGVLVPTGIVLATAGLIAAEPHMSLGLLTAIGGFVLIFLAGASLPKLLVAGGGSLALAVLAAVLKGGGYHQTRLASFVSGMGGDLTFQAEQSVIAIGSGGLLGRGLGHGLQKYFFLPDPHTDFILSILVEELGFAGLLALFLLTGFILWRIFVLGSRCQSRFGELLCYGLGLQLLLAFLMHAAVCFGWAPITGVPFPLMSFGGSALVANLMGLGLVLSVSARSEPDPAWRAPSILLREPRLGGLRR